MNKNTLKHSTLLVAPLLFGTSSWAATISVNFIGGSANPANANRGGTVVNPLASGDNAGVISVGNWNNAGTANDGGVVNAGSNKAGTIAALTDDSGSLTATSTTWTSNNAWSGVVTETDPDDYLMKGYLDTSNSSTTTVEINNIGFGTYDLYLYVEGGNAAGRIGQYEVFSGSGTGGTLLGTIFRVEDAAFWDGTFDQATGATAGAATTGDYILFEGLTASTITVAATGSGSGTLRAPINGLQINQVPEPSSSTLVGIACMGLLLRRKR